IGPACQYEVFDVTKTESVSHLVQSVRSRLGDPTILINNAGINMKKPALEFSDEEMDLILRTHVHGAFALTREVAASMLERRKGSILFIASMASYIGLSQVVPYAAGKSAVLGMVRTLANEWSAQGVRVNAIAPGFIETPMVQKALQGDADRRNRVLLRTPMGKLGEPDDIAYAAVYLCSPAAKYVTGTTLVVDGGTSIGF
ncbi:MAG: SDR family oxidoreductase, partial [bacterium]|nr:SDR family oxidoreductase [bacterium]